ncbi:hypothetical protein MNBD_NITROSPINAE03-2075 [hydrothermal vent metagenome]|uniref:Uncharacterized protein n=1 Tax=hydrothermal vent metagenome TaxID=652676 RepID=A0A3B1CLI4_9ZZZZ
MRGPSLSILSTFAEFMFFIDLKKTLIFFIDLKKTLILNVNEGISTSSVKGSGGMVWNKRPSVVLRESKDLAFSTLNAPSERGRNYFDPASLCRRARRSPSCDLTCLEPVKFN